MFDTSGESLSSIPPTKIRIRYLSQKSEFDTSNKTSEFETSLKKIASSRSEAKNRNLTFSTHNCYEKQTTCRFSLGRVLTQNLYRYHGILSHRSPSILGRKENTSFITPKSASSGRNCARTSTGWLSCFMKKLAWEAGSEMRWVWLGYHCACGEERG